jgi:hypothetical protein
MALTVGSQAAGQFLYLTICFCLMIVRLRRIFQRQRVARLMSPTSLNVYQQSTRGVNEGNRSGAWKKDTSNSKTSISDILLVPTCPSCGVWISKLNQDNMLLSSDRRGVESPLLSASSSDSTIHWWGRSLWTGWKCPLTISLSIARTSVLSVRSRRN